MNACTWTRVIENVGKGFRHGVSDVAGRTQRRCMTVARVLADGSVRCDSDLHGPSLDNLTHAAFRFKCFSPPFFSMQQLWYSHSTCNENIWFMKLNYTLGWPRWHAQPNCVEYFSVIGHCQTFPWGVPQACACNVCSMAIVLKLASAPTHKASVSRLFSHIFNGH